MYLKSNKRATDTTKAIFKIAFTFEFRSGRALTYLTVGSLNQTNDQRKTSSLVMI